MRKLFVLFFALWSLPIAAQGIDEPLDPQTLQKLQVKCDADDADACFAIGKSYLDTYVGETFKPNPDRHYFNARENFTPEFVHKDIAIAAAMFKRACSLGSGEACNTVAELHLGLKYISNFDTSSKQFAAFRDTNLNNAIQYFEQACDLNWSDACLRMARNLSEGDPDDKMRAVELYMRACENAEIDGCEELGGLLNLHDVFNLPSRAAPLDSGQVIQAKAMLEQRCEDKANMNCLVLAAGYLLDAPGFNGEDAKGLEILETSCRVGNNFGCVGNATLLLDRFPREKYGIDIAPDNATGLRLVTEACSKDTALIIEWCEHVLKKQ